MKKAKKYLMDKLKLQPSQYKTCCELDRDFRLSYIDVERLLTEHTSQQLAEREKVITTQAEQIKKLKEQLNGQS